MTPEERAAWDRFMASWASLMATAQAMAPVFTELALATNIFREACRQERENEDG